MDKAVKHHTQASLGFHTTILKHSLIESIQQKDIHSSTRIFNQLLSLHTQTEVSGDILSLGLQLIRLTEPNPEMRRDKDVILLQNLIALRGPELLNNVKHLARLYLGEGKDGDAKALIRSRLNPSQAKLVLGEFGLD